MSTVLLRHLASAGILAIALGCNGPNSDGDPTAPSLAKAGGAAPSVKSTDPAYGDQGTVSLFVHVLGSGFDQNSRAVWALSGDTAFTTTHIRTNTTTFVSSSELVANIDIGVDAQLALYDVMVLTSSGRKGIGTELFEVTAASPIPGASDAIAVNDAGQVVGTDASGIFVFDISTGSLTEIGFSGTAFDIDPAGVTIGGSDAAGLPTYWTESGETWTAHALPDSGHGGGVRSVLADGSAGAGVATLMTGNIYRCGANGCFYKTPAKWTRNAGGGWDLATLPLPAGSPQGWAQNINAAGMAVGMEGTNCCKAFFWDPAGQVTTLRPLVEGASSAAWAINDAGTIIVGNSNAVAVAWIRSSIDVAWSGIAPITLETTSNFCSISKNKIGIASVALNINNSGLAVGQSCGRGVVWQLTGPTAVRISLSGLGPPYNSKAVGISDAAQPVIVGQVNGIGVYWLAF